MTDTFIGCCRRCKLSRRFVAPVLRTHHGDRGYGRKTWEKARDVRAAEPFVGASFSVEAREFSERPGSFWLKCPAGHNVEFKALRGIVTEKKCGARCMASTGPSCECACGGENHGRAHDLSAERSSNKKA